MKLHRSRLLAAFVLLLAPCSAAAEDSPPAEAIAPTEVIRPFNGRDLTGFTTWLKETGHEDPERTFRVTEGMIHVTGEGAGYLATNAAYRDYHVVVEYKWGEKTDGSGNVRNSGLLLHGTGPDGGAGAWKTSLEVQLAQGCEGDFIVIRGKDAEGNPIAATLTSNTRKASDGRTRWDADGEPTNYSGRQFWWSNHAASPLGEWTRVECLCAGDRVTVKINGQTVNEAYNVFPASGQILLQNEGNEIYFRNFEIRPLPKTE